jgi:short-subunit dehydrogenase
MDFFNKIKEKVSDIDIAIVVVCAGFKRADWFKNVSSEDLLRMLDLNVYHYFAMMKTFLPRLESR